MSVSVCLMHWGDPMLDASVSSVTQSSPTLCHPTVCTMPDFTIDHQQPELAQTHVHWVGDAIQPSHPLSSPSPPDFNLSKHQGFFQWVSCSYQVPKYWSFSLSISRSNEYSGLISFRVDSFDLFAAQETLKSLLQHHSSKASILLCSAFFTVQLSRLYMTTGKTIAMTRRTFVGKVMSLLFKIPCIGIGIRYLTVFLWFTSLCIIGSTFVHCISTLKKKSSGIHFESHW